jgi:pre-rRNA-processing protein IPI1
LLAAFSQIDITPMQRLAHTLHPILVSTWLDVAPSVFVADASGDEISAQLAISVAQIAGCLYGTIFRDTDLVRSMRIKTCELTLMLQT